MWENEFTSNEMEVRKCCWHVGIDLFWKRHRNWNKFQKVVTTVFKQYETGLREGRINAEVISNSWIWPFVYLCAWVQVLVCTFNCAWLTQDLHTALVACGLNPMEQEVIDMTNEVARSVEHSSFIMIMFMHCIVSWPLLSIWGGWSGMISKIKSQLKDNHQWHKVMHTISKPPHWTLLNHVHSNL